MELLGEFPSGTIILDCDVGKFAVDGAGAGPLGKPEVDGVGDPGTVGTVARPACIKSIAFFPA